MNEKEWDGVDGREGSRGRVCVCVCVWKESVGDKVGDWNEMREIRSSEE